MGRFISDSVFVDECLMPNNGFIDRLLDEASVGKFIDKR